MMKRPGDDDLDGAPPKKRSGASARTGQACDRCKIRKIRCDARPGGCSPCQQNNVECRTRDRITGRPTVRGHAEILEGENAALKAHLADLQQQLQEHDIEPKAAPYAHSSLPQQPYWQSEQEQPAQWTGNNAGLTQSSGSSMAGAGQNERHGSQATLLPEFRPGLIGDNYLGVSSTNSWLSSREGSSLTLFGMKIDLAEFTPDDDPDKSPMSYKNFIAYSSGTQRAPAPQLPSLAQCKVFAEWWFRTCTPFIPVIHKPDFMDLLDRISSGSYQPTAAETVQVHMMLTIMNWQYSTRNQNQEAFNTAMEHFHYSLGFVPELMTGHTIPDIQALVMICSQLRSQPRPGAAYTFINTVLGVAVEMGLHRSADAWQGSSAEHDPHIIELRKRVFWSLYSLHVSIAGMLGRPMALRPTDFDIEIPQALPDHLPEEVNLSHFRKCSFSVAPHAMRLMSLLSQVYSTIYSVKASNEPYAATVSRIEKELVEYRTNLPTELRGGAHTVSEDRVFTTYLELIENEILLTLHHPSICRTASPQDMQRHLDICMETSNKVLSVATQMKELNALDSTWYCATIHLAAMFTSLFVHTNRQDTMSSADMQKLREEMDEWLEIMGHIGRMLGTGIRLREAIRGIVDYSLSSIQRHIAAKTASAGLASTAGAPASLEQSQPEPQPPPQQQQQPQQQALPSANGYYNSSNGDVPNGAAHGFRMAAPDMRPHEQSNFQTAQTYYPDSQNTSMPAYATASLQAYNSGAYSEPDMKPNMEAQLGAYANPTPPPPQATPATYANHLPVHNGFPNPNATVAGPTAWRDFTQGVMTNMPSGPDYAQTLMALQNPAASSSSPHAGKEAAGVLMQHSAGHMQMPAPAGLPLPLQMDGMQPWPLVHYGGTAMPSANVGVGVDGQGP